MFSYWCQTNWSAGYSSHTPNVLRLATWKKSVTLLSRWPTINITCTKKFNTLTFRFLFFDKTHRTCFLEHFSDWTCLFYHLYLFYCINFSIDSLIFPVKLSCWIFVPFLAVHPGRWDLVSQWNLHSSTKEIKLIELIVRVIGPCTQMKLPVKPITAVYLQDWVDLWIYSGIPTADHIIRSEIIELIYCLSKITVTQLLVDLTVFLQQKINIYIASLTRGKTDEW